MDSINYLTEKLLAFRRARDWEQFHKPKDLALSLCLEAAEVLEHFQWKDEAEAKEYISQHKEEIGEELADVFNWVLLMSHDFGIDIAAAAEKKIAKNEKKYPQAAARGNHKKYTDHLGKSN